MQLQSNSRDAKLHVQGHSSYQLVATIKNIAAGTQSTVDLASAGNSVSQTLEVPQKGTYSVTIGSIQLIVVYE